MTTGWWLPQEIVLHSHSLNWLVLHLYHYHVSCLYPSIKRQVGRQACRQRETNREREREEITNTLHKDMDCHTYFFPGSDGYAGVVEGNEDRAVRSCD